MFLKGDGSTRANSMRVLMDNAAFKVAEGDVETCKKPLAHEGGTVIMVA
jgi:hypothetical protein